MAGKRVYNRMMYEFEDAEGAFKVPDMYKALVDEYLANGYNFATAFKTVIKKRAGGTDYKILDKPEVARYLKLRREQLFKEKMIDAQRIMERLADIGFADKNDAFYTVQNQLKALDMLARSMGMYDKRDADTKETVINIKLEE